MLNTHNHTQVHCALHVDLSPCFLPCLAVSVVSVRSSGLLSTPSRLKCIVSGVPVLGDLAESVPRLSSPNKLTDKNRDSQSGCHYLEIDFSLLIKDEPRGCVHLSSVLKRKELRAKRDTICIRICLALTFSPSQFTAPSLLISRCHSEPPWALPLLFCSQCSKTHRANTHHIWLWKKKKPM